MTTPNIRGTLIEALAASWQVGDAPANQAIASDAAARDVDTILAALAVDPGDLPARMQAALEALLRRNGWDGERTERVDREMAEILHTFMGVKDERVVALAAENDQLRRRTEHAEGQLSAARDHNTRWEHEQARAERAEVERDAARSVSEKLLREAWDAHHDTMDERDALKAAIERVRALPGRTSMGRVEDYVPLADVRAALDAPEPTETPFPDYEGRDRVFADAPETPGDAEEAT